MCFFNSLHQKVTFGYSIIGAAILALSVFTLLELRWMEHQVLAGEQVNQFYDSILELRRFEKNYFLYHQAEDLRQHSEYLHLAQRLLQENVTKWTFLASQVPLTAVSDKLTRYEAKLTGYVVDQQHLAQEIRDLGKELLKYAQDLERAERQQLHATLKRHRYLVIISVSGLFLLIIGMGRVLYQMVAKPLRQMEEQMEAVAQGQRTELTMVSTDREMMSLGQTFNHVLKELEIRRKHLLRSEKLASLGTLLSGVAHELNNPLSNVSTCCQILLEELDNAEREFQRELLTQIDEQTLRMRNIVRSLLDFARDRPFQREALPLASLVQETWRFLRGQIPAQVTIATEIAEELVVPGDKQRLQQALLNLFKNAVEAVANQGEITVRAAYHAPPQLPLLGNSHLCGEYEVAVIDIEIHDNGPGIPLEILPKIFDPFFTTKDVGQGFGLGLAIVYEVVEEHDGCIAVESHFGEGTRFFLRLPAQ